jgi:hypothetical protein
MAMAGKEYNFAGHDFIYEPVFFDYTAGPYHSWPIAVQLFWMPDAALWRFQNFIRQSI